MKVTFEQPIPDRKVYINRELGCVIGDGKPFSPAEFVLLHGLARQEWLSPYSPEEIAMQNATLAEVERCMKVREEAMRRYFQLLDEGRSLPGKIDPVSRYAMTDREALATLEAKKRELWAVVEAATEDESAARARWTKACIKAKDAAHARELARVAVAQAAQAEREVLEKSTVAAKARAALRALTDTLRA